LAYDSLQGAMIMKSLPLGQILIEEKVITEHELELALDHQKSSKKRLGAIIIEMGIVDEADIIKALARRLKVDYLESPLFAIDLETVKLVPENLARKYHIVPLNIREGRLNIVTSDPLDFVCLEDIGMVTSMEVATILSISAEIDKCIDRVYSKRNADEIIEDIRSEYGELNIEISSDKDETAAIVERVDSAPIVKLVNSLVQEAYQENASDIHIEPEETHTRVRFRIDGDLVEHSTFSKDIHGLLTTRIKIISGMNIAEKRVPQDGSFNVRTDYIRVDIRVSSLPTPYGEKIVMRLLGSNRAIDYDMKALGLSDNTLGLLEKSLHIPNGIILVTGPTGSGKTTTLYSMLSSISKPNINIVTVEDPIERRFENITQVQVNPRAGLTFASGLRSILRQDPDVIMVGEIRDAETAEIAIRAAITGHLVLSTVHTNDALSTIIRLIDMGIEPYLVASSVKCVVSQRLVKRICPYCKSKTESKSTDSLLLQTHLSQSFIGRGCQQCKGTGYLGRTPVHEVLVVDSTFEDLITRRAPMEELRAHAKSRNMRMLKDEITELIEQGVTSVEEGLRILYSVD